MKKWSMSDISLLKKLWFDTPKKDLLRIFPDRTWKSLCRRSEELGLKKFRASNNPLSRIESWIDGEMLGDGHITPDGRYSHTTKYSSYADFLEKKFKDIDMTVAIYHHSYIDKRTNKKYSRCLVRTRSFFKEYRNRWYQNKKKIVPDDLIIDDSLFLHWVLGDGTIDKNGYAFSLATLNFDDCDLKKLKSKLLDYGIDGSIQKSKNIVILKSKNSVETVRSFLKSSEYPECYSYKINRLKLWLDKFRG